MRPQLAGGAQEIAHVLLVGVAHRPARRFVFLDASPSIPCTIAIADASVDLIVIDTTAGAGGASVLRDAAAVTIALRTIGTKTATAVGYVECARSAVAICRNTATFGVADLARAAAATHRDTSAAIPSLAAVNANATSLCPDPRASTAAVDGAVLAIICSSADAFAAARFAIAARAIAITLGATIGVATAVLQ